MTFSRFSLYLIPLGLAAQVPETRGIQPEGVVLARPQAKAPLKSANRPRYQATGPAATAAPAKTGAAAGRQVGITIWRLRPAGPNDSGARLLVQEPSSTTEWLPERLASTANLTAGDKVRLSIESPESGYLYVIDRERYANGERGEPYLIFPTTRINGGDNHLMPGKLAEIPAQTDRPNFFTLNRSRANQTAEELTVLLAPMPIAGLTPGPSAIKLTNEQVAAWEKQGSGQAIERFELAGGAGRPWTRAEQEAGAGATRLLTQEDAPPQTVYRAVASSPTDALIVTVNLRYR